MQSAGKPRTPIGRIEDTSTDEAMTLIKSWLQECMESHDQCQIPDASVLPKRVLSISDDQVRLIETDGQVAPYLTLSHCWGRPPFTQMTSRNLDLLKQEIPWTWLSKSFQDAIIITHRLGFQYLWIDGLCKYLHLNKIRKSTVSYRSPRQRGTTSCCELLLNIVGLSNPFLRHPIPFQSLPYQSTWEQKECQ